MVMASQFYHIPNAFKQHDAMTPFVATPSSAVRFTAAKCHFTL